MVVPGRVTVEPESTVGVDLIVLLSPPETVVVGAADTVGAAMVRIVG